MLKKIENKQGKGNKVYNSLNLGDKVNAEDEVVIMDAMKMEIPVYAPEEGTVKEIKVKEGDSVKTDQVLMTLG